MLRLDDRTDRFLAAAITGILHGKSASYLSVLMPNTFSMAPRYVRDFAARTDFASPERDVFDGLGKKLDRLFRQALPRTEGLALLGDARDVAPVRRAGLRAMGRPEQARLVVTSPPYLRVVKYGYYNWLRTWFLGLRCPRDRRDPRRRPPPGAVPRVPSRRRSRACARSSPTTRLSSSSSATSRPTADARSGAASACRTGLGIAAEPEGFKLAGIALDDVAANRKMTKLWGDEAGQATKTDRILVLGATEMGRRRALSGAAMDVDWTWPPRALRPL